jgi:hypothetical protein
VTLELPRRQSTVSVTNEAAIPPTPCRIKNNKRNRLDQIEKDTEQQEQQ